MVQLYFWAKYDNNSLTGTVSDRAVDKGDCKNSKDYINFAKRKYLHQNQAELAVTHPCTHTSSVTMCFDYRLQQTSKWSRFASVNKTNLRHNLLTNLKIKLNHKCLRNNHSETRYTVLYTHRTSPFDSLEWRERIGPLGPHAVLCCDFAHVRETGIGKKFTYGIGNPGLWNPQYSSRNPELQQRVESKTVLDFLTWGDVIASVQSGTETVSSRQR